MKINTPFAAAEDQLPEYRTATWYSFELLPAMQLGLRFARLDEDTELVALPTVQLALHGGPCSANDDFDRPMSAHLLLPKELPGNDRELWLAFLTELRAKVI